MERRARAVVLRARRWSYAEIAEALGMGTGTAWEAVRRYLAEGQAGLVDRREDNGPTKVDDRYLDVLRTALEHKACELGWPRPTWTRELLARTVARSTGTLVAPCTMSRALRRIGARRGRPRPVVICPLSASTRRRRLRGIEELRAHLDPRDVMVYEDEVDIHLNPKIGSDWMPRGLTREVVTPGRNRKAYLAGALDVRSGLVHVVAGDRKHSGLFLDLLARLLALHPDARRIHVVLDNYVIHSSKRVQSWLADRGARIQLHFLPPYSPNENPIERVWLDLHASVTRNHCRRLLGVLLRDVHAYLARRNRAARTARHHAA
jgi:transposase